MISSRCSPVNVNIGTPACGVVRATNNAVLVIPGWLQGPEISVPANLASEPAQRPSRVTLRANLLRQGEAFFLGRRPLARDRSQLAQRAPEELRDKKLASPRTASSPYDPIISPRRRAYRTQHKLRRHRCGRLQWTSSRTSVFGTRLPHLLSW